MILVLLFETEVTFQKLTALTGSTPRSPPAPLLAAVAAFHRPYLGKWMKIN